MAISSIQTDPKSLNPSAHSQLSIQHPRLLPSLPCSLKRRICRRKLKLDIIAEKPVHKRDLKNCLGLVRQCLYNKRNCVVWFLFSDRLHGASIALIFR
ncbi:hypothetical protein ACB092_11G192400 [Castanea dentata]